MFKGNPTRGAFERAVAQAECAKYCVAYSSGSAATSAVIHLLQSGDHVLCIDDVYGGTNRQFRRIVQPTNGISIDFVDFVVGSSTSKKEDDIFHKNRNTKLVWLETPTNPTLKITDIAELSKRMKESNMDTNSNDNNTILLAVDNTFCSPYFQNPLNLGADIVVHSVTKYIGGHSDVVMGVVCCNDEQIYQKLRFIQNGIGAVPSPFDCYLAHRGLKTLHIRMEASARYCKTNHREKDYRCRCSTGPIKFIFLILFFSPLPSLFPTHSFNRNAYAIALFLENHKVRCLILQYWIGLP